MAIQNVSTFSDHNAELESINRNRQLAMMLQNQSLQPIEQQQQPGVLNHPTQGLAKMLQMFVATKMQGMADERHRELTTGMNQKLSEGLQNYQKTLQGTPGIPAPADELGGGPAKPSVPGDRQAAFAQLLASGHPVLQQMGVQQIASEPDRQMRAEEFALRREDARDAREERRQQFGMMLADRQQGRQEQADLRRELVKSGGAGQSPYFQPVQTGEGVFAFNARTGTVEPVRGANGQPIIGAQADPSLQGQIAGAKTGGEARAKREYNMTGLGDTIQEAESILSGKDGGLPTGSGIGAARDAVGGFFGVSTEGSVQAQKLKAMSGALTSKMPRMEGPQSDKDVQMYREMAAEIGNPSVPVERRRAALETVKNLWAKYEPEASRPKPSAFDAEKESRYQAWKKRQGL
ncbi:hypothetical protein [Nitrosovibrio sp. Nv6]|uniref:hypothetical protein n=1 Tax=Nitrosovibrio sp. Nv6 TaxID=1855340 RepID=UPI0008D0567A|nr:hypothetical protein [Nitrosovibrio sp. Nv6]SEO77449.1 hypothetical protein SAMN05216316_1057 [Nitrosovibrio sp. Nv6]